MPSDLETLCRKCHEEAHKIVRDKNGKIVSMQQMGGMRKWKRPIPIIKAKRKWLKVREKRIQKWKERKERLGWSF
jgi:ribosomal protein L44E